VNYRLSKFFTRLNDSIELESSKSESNRVLVIEALSGKKSDLLRLSQARDTITMQRLLNQSAETWDVKDAGTTMRFLTAFLGIRGDGQIITGTERMKKRPIGPLVSSLQQIGCDISYLENTGYPPLKIHKFEHQLSNEIEIPGNISSQYISALLMIAPCLPDGLTIQLIDEVYSKPYIEMTLGLMSLFGATSTWNGHIIKVEPQKYHPVNYVIEGDWSGASYWYSMVALSPRGSELKLSYLKKTPIREIEQLYH
jgi:3-phosphoshikimate 1-carboxyvinyltransferase